MKVIVFKDEDAKYLLEKLKYETLKLVNETDSKEKRFMAEKIHRAFHYHVCKWLQDQGANIL